VGIGALNHWSPNPLTLMANCLQLNVIAETTLVLSTPWADSAVAFDAAIAGRRKK